MLLTLKEGDKLYLKPGYYCDILIIDSSSIIGYFTNRITATTKNVLVGTIGSFQTPINTANGLIVAKSIILENSTGQNQAFLDIKVIEDSKFVLNVIESPVLPLPVPVPSPLDNPGAILTPAIIDNSVIESIDKRSFTDKAQDFFFDTDTKTGQKITGYFIAGLVVLILILILIFSKK